jgi:phosphatidylserine/phosphatidylglycerophosphate/cardiolipin synthase-like enzyme
VRAIETNGPLSVQAIAGTYVVLLGIDVEETKTNEILGFGIQRTDLTNNNNNNNNNNEPVWLAGFKSFKQAHLPRGTIVPTNKHPIQAFLWGDYTVRKDHQYTYRIVAMRGKPGQLHESDEVSVPIEMEKEKKEGHYIYFNRGIAGSQAYVRKFGNKKPNAIGTKAFDWLSRGLVEALISFIRQANGPDWAIHASVYEFQYSPILEEFKSSIDRGVDVKIIFDCKNENIFVNGNPKGPWKGNLKAIKDSDIPDSCIKARKTNPSFISHNKFIVLLQNDVPKQVWTGSTNITIGGIFGHSNVGHLVRDESIAKAYEEYWQQLNKDPEAKNLRPWNTTNFPVPDDISPPNSVISIFSPRTDLEALEWYVSRMDKANTASFLTAAFGVHDLFENVYTTKKNNLRYLMLESEDEDMEKLRSWKYNRISIGNVLGENKFEHWLGEMLTGFNRHVKYIHTKYMLIDPLSEDPFIITGSANFSDASTRNNDENMLVIRGDTRVADIYLTEFMRLFMHFYFRTIVNGIGPAESDPEAGFLKNDNSWLSPYYQKNNFKCKERLYFAGKHRF